jgi:hypothetical protein
MGAVFGFSFDPDPGERGLSWIRYIRHCSGYVGVDLGRVLSTTDEESASGEYEAPIGSISHTVLY